MASSFAVIRTGGKMYRVTPGQVLVVERIAEDGPVIFDEVLMVSEDGVTSYATLEKPLAVEVHGRILRQEKDPKIIVFKKKRRKNYRRKKGHRQLVSRVKIDSIIKTA
ncbi:MAG: 50S ribosomal protein L21 [Nitrospirota bacterium]|nr:50S ribosomal protein L21 [Nitrospirota bacterium]